MLHCSRYAKGAVTSRALHINSNELRPLRQPSSESGRSMKTRPLTLRPKGQKGRTSLTGDSKLRVLKPGSSLSNGPSVAENPRFPQYPGRSVDTTHRLIYRGFNAIESETAPCLAVPSHCLNEPLTEMGGPTCLA